MGLLNAFQFGSYAPGTGMKPPMMPPVMNPGGGIGGGMQQPGMGPISNHDAGLGAAMLGPPPTMGMGPMSNNDFLSAFGNNPQFMQQLQAMQNGQGPGRQAPQFTPPPMQMDTGVNGMSGANRQRGFGQAGGQIDPLAFLRNSQF